MTNKDRINIKRITSVDDAVGVPTKVYTTLARSSVSLPHTDVPCRVQPLPPEEAIELGIVSPNRKWKIYFGVSGNPYLDERDHVIIHDQSGDIEARVVVPSFDFDSQRRLWKAVVEMLGPSTN